VSALRLLAERDQPRRGHGRLDPIEGGDQLGAEHRVEGRPRHPVQGRRARGVGAVVVLVVVGDADRVVLVAHREQAADVRLDLMEVPAALERGAMDRAAAPVVGEEHAADLAVGALVGRGADVLARRVVGIDLDLGREPRRVLGGDVEQRSDLRGVGEDVVALGQVDVGAVLTAGLEQRPGARQRDALVGDLHAPVAHAVGDDAADEDVAIDPAKPGVIEGDEVWRGHGATLAIGGRAVHRAEPRSRRCAAR
jgi:hypothetical protein